MNLMRISTGIAGLDHILNGGLLRSRAYLVHGEPGTGKTTLGLHFLAAGAAAGEGCLLITFGPAETHIRRDAASLGVDIRNVAVLDLTPPPEAFSKLQTYDIFSPAEVELDPLSVDIARAVAHHKPSRIFVDGFEQFRQLAADPFNHRRLIQSFFRFATQNGETLVVASEQTESARDVDGVIGLEFAHECRGLRVTKFRGSDFRAGLHPMRLTGSGLEVPLNAA
jgi:circadian clock protein KaiC